jgi:hypothetical protein
MSIILMGCGQKVWYKPNTSLPDAEYDLKKCQYEMVQHNPSMNMYTGVWLINRCMELKGYQQFDREEIERMGGTVGRN